MSDIDFVQHVTIVEENVGMQTPHHVYHTTLIGVLRPCVRAGATPFCYWSTHGSDDSLAGYQATAATTEELTADCCDRQQ